MRDSKSIPLPATDLPPPLSPAQELARLWEQGQRVDLASFLETVGTLSPAHLADIFHVDQHHRWQRGERTVAESYLQSFPEVSADSDAVVDLIFHEYLIRERLGECPNSKEYADRFPLYADAVHQQIMFHRLLIDTESAFNETATTQSDQPQCGPPAGLMDRARIELVPRGGLSSNREVQSLLRQRLRLLSIISCAAFLLYLPVLWTVLAGSWGRVPYVIVIVQTALFGLLLSSRQPFSLRALRVIETCLFGGLLLFFVWQTTGFFRASSLTKLAAFGWIGPIMAARGLSWSWVVMIIVYGIWIPNTARRAITVVAIMAAVFVALTFGLVLSVESVPTIAIIGFLLCAVTDMLFAAAIAVFGAHRIAVLERAVSEARRLGPYRLVRRLGSGGMGDVYLADHALLRRSCALKIIRPEQCGDLRQILRFEREVQTMATLTHPNTVRIYDYGLAADGTFYYAMEYLPGLSLQELVTRYGPLSPERTIYLLRQVCGALREAHSIGLIHRDIKPANILACYNGGMRDVAKLLDFGLVRVHGVGNTEKSLTGIGTIAGTPAFMSPEQASGATEVDNRSDIYSLGAVAYFLLTGRPPFVSSTSVQVMAAHLSEPVVPLRQLQESIPADLEEVVLRCLEKKPERRFRDAGAVEEALNRCECRDGWSLQQSNAWWQSRDVCPSG